MHLLVFRSIWTFLEKKEKLFGQKLLYKYVLGSLSDFVKKNVHEEKVSEWETLLFSSWKMIFKGALCSFREEIQTQNL